MNPLGSGDSKRCMRYSYVVEATTLAVSKQVQISETERAQPNMTTCKLFRAP